jgi:hypothetical protein
MLQDEGQYAEVCGDDRLPPTSALGGGGGVMCPARAERFASIFATASFLVNGISLPSGLFLDRCGGRAVSGEATNANEVQSSSTGLRIKLCPF